jgi:hypothetical protein
MLDEMSTVSGCRVTLGYISQIPNITQNSTRGIAVIFALTLY